MTAASEQIIYSFEELEMTPEQIAQDQELDVTAVKSVLMQFSTKYRGICRNQPESPLNFTEDEAVRARKVIVELMDFAEDENLRFRAACRVHDDKKGRLDGPKLMNGLNINVLQINERFKRAMEVINKPEQKVIEG